MTQRIMAMTPNSTGTGVLKFRRIVTEEVGNRIDFNIQGVKGGFMLTAPFMQTNTLTAECML